MQFNVIAITLFAAVASALPQGVGPVTSGGSCSAETTTTKISIIDCLLALVDLRNRGDNPNVACDRAWRSEYNYVTKGACQVVTLANGNPQCMNPKDVADGLTQIINLCKKDGNVRPGEYTFFRKQQTVKVVAATKVDA